MMLLVMTEIKKVTVMGLNMMANPDLVTTSCHTPYYICMYRVGLKTDVLKYMVVYLDSIYSEEGRERRQHVRMTMSLRLALHK